jgi:hypothetical protein
LSLPDPIMDYRERERERERERVMEQRVKRSKKKIA